MTAKRKPKGGRKPGTPNKMTVQVKEALELAFQGLGGVEGLIRWGKRYPSSFYRLWVRMLPRNLTLAGPDGGPVRVADATKQLDAELDRLTEAFALAAARQDPSALPADGAPEPVGAGPHQAGDHQEAS